MSSYRVILYIFLILIFAGCVADKNQELTLSTQKESELIMFGLDSEASGDYQSAYTHFSKLYTQTHKFDYFLKQIKLLIELERLDEAIVKISQKLKESQLASDRVNTLKRTLVSIYINKKSYDSALKIAKELLKARKSESNYELVSTVYILKKEYREALKYLDSAYAMDYSEDILDKIVTIYYIYIGDKDMAISYLQTHIRLNSCSKKLCSNLVALYAEKQDIEGLISIYRRMYKELDSRVYAKKLIELLVFKKNFQAAIEFLKKSRVDDNLLLELYKMQGDFQSAKELSLKLFKEREDINYLAQSAMFEYEGAKDKSDRGMLNSVTEKLKEVVSVLDSDTYQNYLGYLLIEHNLDVDNGILLVKEALKKNPDSIYYLDSLAWGYYRLKKCKDAYRVMKKVVDRVGVEDSEVKLHWDKILKCYRGSL